MNLADLLSARATATPRTVAVIHGNLSLSLASIDAAVWSMTRNIARVGLKAGDVVGLQAMDPLLHLIATFAMARMGVVHLAVSSDALVASQSAELLQRIGAVAVFTDKQPQNELIANYIPVDLDTIFSGNGAPDPTLRVDGGDRILLFKSSSGTTGRPKLIGATHAGMIASIEREQTAVRYLAGERYLTPVAMQFDAPKRRYISCIVSGSTAVMPPTVITLQTLFELIDRHDIRHFSCVPVQAHDIASSVPPGKQRLPNMRCFRLSAAPSDRRLIDLLHERICSNVVISYGCSELGPMTFIGPQEILCRPHSVGRPMPGIEIEIVSNADEAVPAGGTGIVRVRAKGMPNGYFDSPEATARHFRSGWFYPGDLGAISVDNELTLMGRADDMMIYEGVNISPQEIEIVLQAYPGVRDAAAFPLRSKRAYQIPAAAVVIDEGTDLGALNRFVRERLASRAPMFICAVDQMPRNEGGKVIKRKLAEFAETYLKTSSGKHL